jgi:hypothetical protein
MDVRPVYTHHAREALAEYGLTEADVEPVLRAPDRERLDRDGNRRLSGPAAGRRQTVVVAKDSDPPRIITLWPTSRRRNR